MSLCKSCHRVRDEHGPLLLDRFGYCAACIEGMRDDDMAGLLEVAEMRDEQLMAERYPEEWISQ